MPSTKALKLPPPDPRYFHYTLGDGSRIYPSGVQYHDITKECCWFAWHCTGKHESDEWDEAGKRRSVKLVCDGEVLMDRRGIRYFDSPQEALAALQEVLK